MEFRWSEDYLDEGDYRLFIDGKASALVAYIDDDGSAELEEGMLEGHELPESWGELHAALLDQVGASETEPVEESSEALIEDEAPIEEEADAESVWMPSASKKDQRAAAKASLTARRKQQEALGEVVRLRTKVLAGVAAGAVLLASIGGFSWYSIANQPQPASASVMSPPTIHGSAVIPSYIQEKLDSMKELVNDGVQVFNETKDKVAKGGDKLRHELRDTLRYCRDTIAQENFPKESDLDNCMIKIEERISAVEESHEKWEKAEEQKRKEREEQERRDREQDEPSTPPNQNTPPPTQNPTPPPTNNPPPPPSNRSFTIRCSTAHNITVIASGGSVNIGGQSGSSATLQGGPGAVYNGTYSGNVSMSGTGTCSIG